MTGLLGLRPPPAISRENTLRARQQLAMDAATPGSVGLPGGLLGMRPPQPRDNPLRTALAIGSFAPGIGDALGVLADAHMYATDPSSRTPLNFGLTGLGLLPFIPAVGATVFHGSPHKFDAFDMSKIGTGEGAQAYGHGLYFADAPDVAKQYSADRSYVGRYMQSGATTTHGPEKIAQDAIDRVGDAEKAAEELGWVLKANSRLKAPGQSEANKEVQSAIDLLTSGQIARKGSLYHVDLPDEAIAKMLDWDKPLSEQADNVKQAFRRLTDVPNEQIKTLVLDAMGGVSGVRGTSSTTGGDLYRKLAEYQGWTSGDRVSAFTGQYAGNPEKAVTDYLQSLGIPGIRYLDAGSRGSGKGTSNYVVFDDKLLKILKRE